MNEYWKKVLILLGVVVAIWIGIHWLIQTMTIS